MGTTSGKSLNSENFTSSAKSITSKMLNIIQTTSKDINLKNYSSNANSIIIESITEIIKITRSIPTATKFNTVDNTNINTSPEIPSTAYTKDDINLQTTDDTISTIKTNSQAYSQTQKKLLIATLIDKIQTTKIVKKVDSTKIFISKIQTIIKTGRTTNKPIQPTTRPAKTPPIGNKTTKIISNY